MNFKPRHLNILISAAIAFSVSVVAHADPEQLPAMTIIDTTPLPGLGKTLDEYAGNVQIITAEQIEEQHAVDTAELLFRNIGSIDINSAQNNPFQNDVHYRGFLASPLVGSSIGLSTYVDGVRVNEGFGDTVNWDLIPSFSLNSLVVIPGSNPLFGLNTLGGALSLKTKSGLTYQGSNLEVSVGSDDRRQTTFEHGGNQDNLHWYVGGTQFKEDGWRVNSPSDVKQFFGKLGWTSDTSNFDVSYTQADTDLIGNGFVADSRLKSNGWDAIHSYPDQTENELKQLNLNASHWINDNMLLSSNAFYRDYKRKTLNGDVEVGCSVEVALSGDEFESDTHLSKCIQEGDAAGSTYTDEFGVTQTAVLGDEWEVEIEGEERRTETETDTWGGTLQLANDTHFMGKESSWTVGVSYDRASTDFLSIEAEEGDVDLTNGSIIPGTVSEAEVGVDIETTRENYALFLTDTIYLNEDLALTIAGRYQHSSIEIDNNNPGDEALEGDHSFSRFNPAINLSHKLNDNVMVYGSYNESFRTPTAAELTCADPDDPCKLPNSFVADPPLDPVIGKTFEIGARGQLNLANINWSIAAFHTQLKDDLLFTLANNDGGGYFINVDETRRQGLEVSLNSKINDKLKWFSHYSLIDATFQSDELLSSVINPNGVAVSSGDEMPAIPRHNIKLGADYAFTPKFSSGVNMNYASSSYMRGDESNELEKISGYTVFNLNARYKPNKTVQFWAKVDNVFDTEYENSGIRNFNFYNLPAAGETISEERFVSPGAPRSFWGGVAISF